MNEPHSLATSHEKVSHKAAPPSAKHEGSALIDAKHPHELTLLAPTTSVDSPCFQARCIARATHMLGISPLGIGRALYMATISLRSYILRSIFVITAVALGIASLTVIIAAVEGAERKAEEMTSMFGPDAVLVFGGSFLQRATGSRMQTLTLDDAAAIRTSLPGAYLVIPMRAQSNVTLKTTTENYTVGAVIGATADYAKAWNWPLEEGRDFTENDIQRGERICLIGDLPAKELFGDTNPIGKTLFMAGVPLTVVGKLEYRGASGGGGNVDDRIIVPLTTLTQRFNLDRHTFRALRIKFSDQGDLEYHINELTSLLRDLHNLLPEEADDFTILSSNDVRRFLSIIKGGLVLFLGITAASAMVVGGFVLANLFFLSVSERRVEIGLRKALGASSRAILFQFLWEALLLTLCGAFFGILVGMIMGQALEGFGLLTISLSWKVIVAAILAAVAVGCIFGLRPAKTAAQLDPITALRGGE